MIPTKMFLTHGTGMHRYRLHSFELALRHAGIQSCNLVKVSSIIPPYCKLISREEGISLLHPGEITYCVLSTHRTKRKISGIGSCIGLAVPSNKESYGYVAEHHGSQITRNDLIQQVESLARTMLTTRQGKTCIMSQAILDENSSMIESSKDCSVSSICQYVEETQEGVWTTVLTAAVFIE